MSVRIAPKFEKNPVPRTLDIRRSTPNGVCSRRCSLPFQRRQYTAFDREMSIAIHTGVPLGGRFGGDGATCRWSSTARILSIGASILAAALTAARSDGLTQKGHGSFTSLQPYETEHDGNSDGSLPGSSA